MENLNILLRNRILTGNDLDRAIEKAIQYHQPETEAALLAYKNKAAGAEFDIERSVDSRFCL